MSQKKKEDIPINVYSQSVQFNWSNNKELENKGMSEMSMMRENQIKNRSKTKYNQNVNHSDSNPNNYHQQQKENKWVRSPMLKKRKVMRMDRNEYNDEGQPDNDMNKENYYRENEMQHEMTDTNNFGGGNYYGNDQRGYNDNDYGNNNYNNYNKNNNNNNNNKGGGYGNNSGNSGGGDSYNHYYTNNYNNNGNKAGAYGGYNNNNGGYGNNGQHKNRGGFGGRGYIQNQYIHQNNDNQRGRGRGRGQGRGRGGYGSRYRSGVSEPGHRYGGGGNGEGSYSSKYNSYSGKKLYEHGNLNRGHRKYQKQWNNQQDFDDHHHKMNKSISLQQTNNNNNTNYSKSTRKSENNKARKLLPIFKESDVGIFRKYNEKVLLHIYSDDCKDADEFNKILNAIAEDYEETIFCKIEWRDIDNLKDELNLVLVDLPIVICFIDNKNVCRWHKLNWAKDSLFGNLDIGIVKDALFQQKMINRNVSYCKDNTTFLIDTM